MDIVTHDNKNSERAFMRFGMQSLLDQLSALSREINGVIESSEPEYVHRMRVATRRIRTRLALFGSCLPDKKGAAWSKTFGVVTKTLGDARDADVQILFVESFLGTLSGKDTFGVNRLLLRLKQKRKRLQKKVAQTMIHLQSSGVIKEMEETLRVMLGSFILDQDMGSKDRLFKSAYDDVSRRLTEMLGYSIYIHDPFRVNELHEMRIAAKHLRYSMEAFEAVYQDQMPKHIKVVKSIQEMLGDIHDCDIWLEFLPEFLAEERALALDYLGHTRSVGKLKRGIDLLLADRGAFREKRYREFIEYWKENAETWPALMVMLSEPIGHGEQPASRE
jgi:CHAD domain-containing protein